MRLLSKIYPHLLGLLLLGVVAGGLYWYSNISENKQAEKMCNMAEYTHIGNRFLLEHIKMQMYELDNNQHKNLEIIALKLREARRFFKSLSPDNISFFSLLNDYHTNEMRKQLLKSSEFSTELQTELDAIPALVKASDDSLKSILAEFKKNLTIAPIIDSTKMAALLEEMSLYEVSPDYFNAQNVPESYLISLLLHRRFLHAYAVLLNFIIDNYQLSTGGYLHYAIKIRNREPAKMGNLYEIPISIEPIIPYTFVEDDDINGQYILGKNGTASYAFKAEKLGWQSINTKISISNKLIGRKESLSLRGYVFVIP